MSLAERASSRFFHGYASGDSLADARKFAGAGDPTSSKSSRELPHIFVNEARIRVLEVQEAISAFEAGREYEFERVRPFVAKLADAIDINGEPQFVVEHGIPIRTQNYNESPGLRNARLHTKNGTGHVRRSSSIRG